MPRRLSLRDRFFTPKVARAVTSPSAILATGATAALGVVVFSNPLGLLAGLVGYTVRVALAIPHNPRSTDIDPFAVGEPWRYFVQDALQAQRRFGESIHSMARGPLRDNLTDIGTRLDTGVDEVWRIAKQGHILAGARSRLTPEEAEHELAALFPPGSPAPEPGSTVAKTAESLQIQIDTARRMEKVIRDAVDQLRLMDARLDEMVSRAVEMSVRSTDSVDPGGLGSDVDGLVTEMEALRQALDETSNPRPSAGQA